MRLTIRGYDPIVIPGKLLKPMSNGLKQDTSYISKIAARWKSRSYVTDKLPSKLLCLESVRDRALHLGGYESYLDLLAGVGMSARIFEAPRNVLNDFDPDCYKVLQSNCPKAHVTSCDITKFKGWTAADLVFVDFNDYTLKRGMERRYREVIENAVGLTRDFLIINDCTPFYFRYGEEAFKTYSRFMKKRITTVGDYFLALPPFYKPLGLFLIHVAHFKDSSFQLWSKRPLVARTPLSVKKIERAPLGMVQVDTGGSLF